MKNINSKKLESDLDKILMSNNDIVGSLNFYIIDKNNLKCVISNYLSSLGVPVLHKILNNSLSTISKEEAYEFRDIYLNKIENDMKISLSNDYNISTLNELIILYKYYKEKIKDMGYGVYDIKCDCDFMKFFPINIGYKIFWNLKEEFK